MKSQVWNIAILSSKNLLAAALENKSVEVLDFNTGEIKHSHEFHSNPVTQVKFTTDGKLLISACAGGNLVVYSLDSSDCMYDENIHTAPIVAMSISFDNKYTVTSSAIASDGVIIWDIERCCKKFIYTNKEHFKEPIVSIFCTSTNTVVFGGYEGNVFILDYLTNKLLKNEPKKIEKRKIYSIIVKNDLSEIILADHHDWINRYSYPDVEDISGNFEDRNYLTGLVYDKNEERIFGISGGKSIREFINDEELTRLGTIGHDTLVCVKITRDRKYLAGFYLDGGVVFYDPGSGKVEHYFESIGEAYQMIEEYPEFGIHLDDEDIG
jgi:WD40 repeat protein